MVAGDYFKLAMLIVLLMPVVVMPLEGRRVPDLFYVLIAAGGLVISAWSGGLPGFGAALATAIGLMLLVGGGITLLRSATRLRILTGGQIKLMAAGSTWLGASGSMLMIVFAFIALFAVAVWRQVSKDHRRSGTDFIVVIAIMAVTMQQYVPLS